ncbi:LytR family transcriptional regulator [Pediococcus pentosaceus]|uniref:LCP family protein n=1 Tax=Pediococcus pentosaceus TaxID=1255 RepID=UPI00223AE84B|nr:LCP family protein [Pediococcus pentosaceus]MCT1177710.1 LytR family transcriptional regulator [Pediococcus pentosaceus]
MKFKFHASDSSTTKIISSKKLHKQIFNNKTKFIVFILFILLVVITLVAGCKKYSDLKTAAGSIYRKETHKQLRDPSSRIKANKPVSILLLGTDTGALGRNYKGRTDTIIVATLNVKKRTMTLTSIPRDTYIETSSSSEKINAVYDKNGPDGTVEAVQHLLNVPIDYYALVNMGGLRKTIDEIGGIDLKPNLTFKYGHVDVKKNVSIHLNGNEALDYTRMRYQDPEGDYGRQQRQKQVIVSILKKSNRLSSLLKQSFLKQLEKEIQTDMNFDVLKNLKVNYHVATHHLKSTHLQGQGETIDGSSYEVIPGEEISRVHDFISSSLK